MDFEALINSVIPTNPTPAPSGAGIQLSTVENFLAGVREALETAAAKTATPFDDMALRLGGDSLFSKQAAHVLHAKLVQAGWGR